MYQAWGLEISPELVRIQGRILPAEKIYVGENRSYDSRRDANWDRDLRSFKLLKTVNITNWVMLFVSRAGSETKMFIKNLQKVAKEMDFEIAEPKL